LIADLSRDTDKAMKRMKTKQKVGNIQSICTNGTDLLLIFQKRTRAAGYREQLSRVRPYDLFGQLNHSAAYQDPKTGEQKFTIQETKDIGQLDKIREGLLKGIPLLTTDEIQIIPTGLDSGERYPLAWSSLRDGGVWTGRCSRNAFYNCCVNPHTKYIQNLKKKVI
jgi:hypothetical protein